METHGSQAPGDPLPPGASRRIPALREPNVNQVCLWIEHGRLDGGLAVLEAAIAARHAARKAKLDDEIKEIYGPDAHVAYDRPKAYGFEPNSAQCGAELGGVPTCGPASDCPHQPR